ncbi:hypothetical protein ACGFMM_11140 [Streptomyces sp. NPDC048604]|uniref:hypothetical protein n=1 Tax=Streptomyces sp. NPDC048604 TaxID=3365578 RepID=UPI003721F934
MTENAETPRRLSGAFQEDSAGGGASAATVPDESPAIDPGDIVQLWAEARALYFAGVYPKYASPAWMDLEPDDPKRLAGALQAAEMWRKYGDEEALIEWLRSLDAPRTPLWARRTKDELDELAKPAEPHQLQATPGWPPIRIPGGHGRYLTYTEERRAA